VRATEKKNARAEKVIEKEGKKAETDRERRGERKGERRRGDTRKYMYV